MVSTGRIETLDGLRGVAVMGILAMNVIAFAMPEPAYINPVAWGHESAADIWAWAAAFLLIDGKMRGLFSMLFGASMLLMYERGLEAGEDAGAAHKRRMAWLLAIGLAHYYLLWDGDILALYALCGFAGLALLPLEGRTLLKVAAVLMLLSVAIYVALALSFAATVRDALAPDAPEAALAQYRALMQQLGGPGAGAAMAKDVALFQGGYGGILDYRTGSEWSGPFELLIIYGLETLALMAIGMALLRNGFLTGAWTADRYRRFALVAYVIGLPPSIALAVWCWWGGFDAVDLAAATIAWATPFRIATMLGHAALIVWALRAFAHASLTRRVIAAGRAGFSNYLATSLVMTTLFYGYGFGLFGQVSRWQAYALCVPVWIAMLAWSKPWLDHYRYGPMEWAWRSLARGRIEKIRI
jgi:uncharacterized protein